MRLIRPRSPHPLFFCTVTDRWSCPAGLGVAHGQRLPQADAASRGRAHAHAPSREHWECGRRQWNPVRTLNSRWYFERYPFALMNWCINCVLMRVMDAVKETIADVSSVSPSLERRATFRSDDSSLVFYVQVERGRPLVSMDTVTLVCLALGVRGKLRDFHRDHTCQVGVVALWHFALENVQPSSHAPVLK